MDKIKSHTKVRFDIVGDEEKYQCFEYVGKLYSIFKKKDNYTVIEIKFSRNKKINVLVNGYEDQLKLIYDRRNTVRLFFTESTDLREKYGEEFQYVLVIDRFFDYNPIIFYNNYNNILYFLKKNTNNLLAFWIGSGLILFSLFFGGYKDFRQDWLLILILFFISKQIIKYLKFKW